MKPMIALTSAALMLPTAAAAHHGAPHGISEAATVAGLVLLAAIVAVTAKSGRSS